MSEDLLSELSEEELAAPDFYPIEYALMWLSYGKKPINVDYAKIIYGAPPKVINNAILENAEKKLLTYLRSGKITSKTMDYEENSVGKFISTGKHVTLEREAWKGSFSWLSRTLSYKGEGNIYYECTDIIVSTKDLLSCNPVGKSVATIVKKTDPKSNFLPKEKDSLLKIVLGLVLTNYEYKPHASRNSTSREIVDDLLLHGISVDEDTVRKWLSEAKELLPNDWKPNK